MICAQLIAIGRACWYGKWELFILNIDRHGNLQIKLFNKDILLLYQIFKHRTPDEQI